MIRTPIFCLSAVLWAFSFLSIASAADIRRNDVCVQGDCHVDPLHPFILEGTIVPGDYENLRKLIDEDCPGKYYNSAGYIDCHSSIYLASPGGDVAEAMKIGRLVRVLRWQTEIPEEYPSSLRSQIISALKLKEENYMCASACFFVYVAGIERNYGIDKAILGVHRPYLSDANLRMLSANEAMASATEVRAIVETYLKEMGVPTKYADLMFSIPKDQVQWIDEGDLNADFTGIIPELRDWLDARCDKRADVDKRLQNALEEKFSRGDLSPEEEEMRRALFQKFDKPQVDCKEMLKDKLRGDAWKVYRGL